MTPCLSKAALLQFALAGSANQAAIRTDDAALRWKTHSAILRKAPAQAERETSQNPSWSLFCSVPRSATLMTA
jgi:hypothetical protein